jgi:ABC-type transport system involved in multi-copper enzyme maturation permease subunit
VTFDGVRTMALHEFRLRLRAGRWRWLLGAWFATLLALTVVLRWALLESGQTEPGTDMFGGLMLFMLGLALLVVPALTAQSVNGDRERGVLAILQTTLLTPAEIAVGKLVAAWGVSLVFLVVSLPLIWWCIAEGGVSVTRVAVCLGVTALLLGVIGAIAQCLSALLARSTTSAVMSYLAVFALTVGTVIAFGLAVSVTQQTVPAGTGAAPFETTQSRPDRVWWLLAPNPFVIVADAAPRPAVRAEYVTELDLLGELGRAARSVRYEVTVQGTQIATDKAVWPYGLAANLLLGAGAVALTTRRLKAPYARLPKAVRVA